MEKEIPESMTTVNIKPEYAPSESFGSEAPPAYHRQKSTAVQVTKIIAVTVVLVTFVLGGFVLASAYITANASCRHLEQELALLTETLDRYQSSGPLQPEALVQEEIKIKQETSPTTTAETKTNVKVIHKDDNNLSDDSSNEYDSDDSDSDDDSSSEEQDRIPIHIKLPLQLDFDDLAGALIEKNQRSRMNCIVEKKRAEEVVDHQPKNINLPFGVNITTDPRYEHISGERMAIFCESGNMLRNDPQQRDNAPDNTDTVMIQPIMIPIPPSNYPTHMNMNQHPMMQQQQQQHQPMHPMEQMRPPMPHPMMMMPPQQQQQQQQQNEPQGNQQSHLPPSAVLHHIAQQIIMQQLEAKHRAAAAEREEAERNELGGDMVMKGGVVPMQQRLQEMQRMSRIPIPAAILNELQRIPSNARGEVIVAVSQDPSDNSAEPQPQLPRMPMIPMPMPMAPQQQQQQQQQQQSGPPQPAEIVRVVQHARESAQGMNGRQTAYARGLPVDIPVPMMQQEAEERAAQAGGGEQEESRPHYVHPRSVRSVDSVLKSQKRVKRCACDCAC